MCKEITVTRFLSIIFSGLLVLLSGCGDEQQTANQKTAEETKIETSAIYVAANVSDLNLLMDMAKQINANAIVIDIKDEYGKLTCKLDIDGIETVASPIENMKSIVKELKTNGFYTIARIVAFKDHIKENLSIKNENKSVWTDEDGASWLNPYNAEAIKYIADITAKTADLGFDEIQYDFARFPASLKEDINLGDGSKEKQRTKVITEFLKEQAEVLHKVKVKLSTTIEKDVIAEVSDQAEDNIKALGQDYAKIAEVVDSVCPKIYPSQFEKKTMGIDNPDEKPYDTVKKVLELSEKVLKSNSNAKAIVRPYLQAFTSKKDNGHEYTKKEIDEQIKAAKEIGIKQIGLFNFSGNYNFE